MNIKEPRPPPIYHYHGFFGAPAPPVKQSASSQNNCSPTTPTHGFIRFISTIAIYGRKGKRMMIMMKKTMMRMIMMKKTMMRMIMMKKKILMRMMMMKMIMMKMIILSSISSSSSSSFFSSIP
jgi:hypothetical protein